MRDGVLTDDGTSRGRSSETRCPSRRLIADRYQLGAGLWLLFLTFTALYGLFIAREVIAMRQKGK